MKGWRLLVWGIGFLMLVSCQKTADTAQPAPAVKVNVIVSPTKYNESQILRVPGNYQNWDIPNAPMIVSVNSDGKYEGYIRFTVADSFWITKGNSWENVTTYNQTGPNSFGFNGSFFSLAEGTGIYRFRADMNNYTWSAAKIISWSLEGTAVQNKTDAVMVTDPTVLSWHTTMHLSKGDFMFRSDNPDPIILGQKTEAETGVPDYNGEPIQVTTAGNYTVTLSLQSAGNYYYGLQKN